MSSYWFPWRRGLGSGLGGWFACGKMREKGKGWGGVGWGPAKEPASQCARVCGNYPVVNYPLVSPRFSGSGDH